MKKICLLLISLLILTGCAGMSLLAKYVISKEAAGGMAIQNAIINAGLAKGYFTYGEVDELVYYMAKLIEISSDFDKVYYTETYNKVFAEAMAKSNEAEFKALCIAWRDRKEGGPANLARQYAREYYDAAQFLAVERQKEAAALESFAQAMGALATSTNPMQYSNITIPEVNFMPNGQTVTNNYLVNTGNGLHQCRVTSNGFVFCF